jgi:hypothetical protein
MAGFSLDGVFGSTPTTRPPGVSQANTPIDTSVTAHVSGGNPAPGTNATSNLAALHLSAIIVLAAIVGLWGMGAFAFRRVNY